MGRSTIDDKYQEKAKAHWNLANTLKAAYDALQSSGKNMGDLTKYVPAFQQAIQSFQENMKGMVPQLKVLAPAIPAATEQTPTATQPEATQPEVAQPLKETQQMTDSVIENWLGELTEEQKGQVLQFINELKNPAAVKKETPIKDLEKRVNQEQSGWEAKNKAKEEAKKNPEQKIPGFGGIGRKYTNPNLKKTPPKEEPKPWQYASQTNKGLLKFCK
jgi:hypothetical protein